MQPLLLDAVPLRMREGEISAISPIPDPEPNSTTFEVRIDEVLFVVLEFAGGCVFLGDWSSDVAPAREMQIAPLATRKYESAIEFTSNTAVRPKHGTRLM